MKVVQHLMVVVITLAGAVGIGFFLHLLPETGLGERLGTDLDVLPVTISALYPAVDSVAAYALITVVVLVIVAAAVIIGVTERVSDR